jgi:hypothetical protein
MQPSNHIDLLRGFGLHKNPMFVMSMATATRSYRPADQIEPRGDTERLPNVYRMIGVAVADGTGPLRRARVSSA